MFIKLCTVIRQFFTFTKMAEGINIPEHSMSVNKFILFFFTKKTANYLKTEIRYVQAIAVRSGADLPKTENRMFSFKLFKIQFTRDRGSNNLVYFEMILSKILWRSNP